jgi:hypothetical protein
LEVGHERLHPQVHLVTEGPHRLQVIAWEPELPVLLAGGGSGQRWARGVPAHGDDQVGCGQQVGGDGLGLIPSTLMPRAARAAGGRNLKGAQTRT